jgi:aspartyl-tRNA(Asn)/glutamyl-tRNA(Gln) amidotransferase subunit B
VEYEVRRQIAAVENGDRIRQETRGWNEAKGETYAMRSKEDADEYRYFPEPDLPPVVVTEVMVNEQKNELGLLPSDLRTELAAANLPVGESEGLVADPAAAFFWHEVITLDPAQAKFAFNWLIGDRVKLADTSGTNLTSSALTPETLVKVAEMVSEGALSSSNAKALLSDLWTNPADPLARATELNLLQQSDTDELGKIVDEVIAANPQAVADYQSGNQRAFGALVGQAMKATQGKGNPPVINKLLKNRLG